MFVTKGKGKEPVVLKYIDVVLDNPIFAVVGVTVVTSAGTPVTELFDIVTITPALATPLIEILYQPLPTLVDFPVGAGTPVVDVICPVLGTIYNVPIDPILSVYIRIVAAGFIGFI